MSEPGGIFVYIFVSSHVVFLGHFFCLIGLLIVYFNFWFGMCFLILFAFICFKEVKGRERDYKFAWVGCWKNWGKGKT